MEQKLSRDRIEHLRQDYEQGFVRYCGFKAEEIEYGSFTSRVKIKDHHRQQDGFIHAGVMATMADHTAGYSAFTVVDEAFQILTIEFKINFFKPAFGEELECRSTTVRKGRQILVAESEVYDCRKDLEKNPCGDQGEGEKVLVAKATVTLMAVLNKTLLQKKG
ncbi:MAG: PaaI family thioesterase [Desulfobacterium sp.]|jgi:uncharacterized protein (TIGR00369 family)|nr:PaaI family thioesterase [Desulfobacterium sp.]